MKILSNPLCGNNQETESPRFQNMSCPCHRRDRPNQLWLVMGIYEIPSPSDWTNFFLSWYWASQTCQQEYGMHGEVHMTPVATSASTNRLNNTHCGWFIFELVYWLTEIISSTRKNSLIQKVDCDFPIIRNPRFSRIFFNSASCSKEKSIIFAF